MSGTRKARAGAQAAPAQAQAPAQAKMTRIPLTTESYQHPSLPLSAKTLLNFYVEQEPSDARSETALISTPGMYPYWTVGTGPIQAINDDLAGRWYVVSGTHFYRMQFLPNAVVQIDDMGDIGTPDSGVLQEYGRMYTIAVDINSAVVCVPPRAYTCGHNTGQALNQIGGDFPGGSSVVSFDNYFVFANYPAFGVSNNIDNFFISKINDPSSYDALDFASSESVPNALMRVVANSGDLWLMGASGLEVWYDSGPSSTLDFPFRRRAGGIVPFPVASARSIAIGDMSVFWVGPNDIVYRSVGYQARRISTHAVEAVIRNAPGSGGTGAYNVISAFCYSQDGHVFYCLNFSTLSLVYDLGTGKWHNRSSSTDGNGRWFPNGTARYSDLVVFGDSRSGKLMLADPEMATADGVQVMRQVILPPLWGGTSRAFCHRLEVEMEVGGTTSPGDVVVDWSDDGGFTWSGGPRTMNAGTTGERRKRVYTTRLGSFRQRVFRITVRGHATLYAVDAAISGAVS